MLLREAWRPELDALCRSIEARYPFLGQVRARAPKPDSGEPTTFLIDGATITMNSVMGAYPPEQLRAPVRLAETVDVEAIADQHFCYMLLGADVEESVELVEAYSALLTMLSTVICEQASALAAFWPTSWAMRTPQEMFELTARLTSGLADPFFWVSLAEVRSAKLNGIDMRGMMTFGLRAFVGREVEVAPAPVSVGTARAFTTRLVERMMAGEEVEDKTELLLPGFEEPAVVRLADRFMRPSQPVALLILPGSIIDPETMKPRKGGASSKPGGSSIVSRLFGNRG